jgi:hypothetical protein
VQQIAQYGFRILPEQRRALYLGVRQAIEAIGQAQGRKGAKQGMGEFTD